MRSSTPLRVGGLALAGIVIASVAVISVSGGDTSVADRIALASVRRGTVASYVSAAGNTVDTGVRDLAFGAEGMVEKVYVTVGQKVRRGKVLARIDDTIAKENYEAAKAALAAARETLENVKNGTATTGASAGGPGARASGGATGIGSGSQGGTGAGAGAGASTGGAGGTGASGGGAGAGTTNGAGASIGRDSTGGAGASGGGTGSGTPSGTGADGTGGAGAGTGTAGGSGPVTCPTPSARPSAQPSTRPSSTPSKRPASSSSSSRLSSSSSSSSSSRSSARPAAWSTGATTTAITMNVQLVAYTTGYHGGDHDGPMPEPGPTAGPEPSATPSGTSSPQPTATRTHTPRQHHHPRPKPSATHRPSPAEGGTTAPDPVVTVSPLPTTPEQPPSATPSPSPGGSSACAPGQGGRGQGTQGQGTRGQGGGAAGRTGFGGGQASRGGQAGQGGQGGGARLTEAQAEAQVSQATTELAEAKKALAGVKIKAPADGTILSVAGTVGSRYTSGTFITLGDLDALQVQALFTESDIRFLKVGQAATVTLSTEPGKEYPGTVAHIDPTPTTSNRLVRYGVTIDLKNRPARMLLGQSATIRVTTEEAADALYVPSQAVHTESDGTAVVTVADGGTQTRRTVKIGVRGDTYVEITDGLAEGDQVVLPGTTTAFPDEGFPVATGQSDAR